MADVLLRQALLLVQPVGLIWLTCILIALHAWRNKRRRLAAIHGALVLLITLFGSTDFPSWLLRTLEKPWAGIVLESLPQADAVVVLGGGAEPSTYEAGGLHLTKAGDRLWMGMELLKQGKALTLVIGGGAADFHGELRVEADLVASWLLPWLEPLRVHVISIGHCKHTRDEAEKVAAMAKEKGWRSVLLVTSANHMRRAYATFSTAGVNAIPVPCNFLTSVSTAPPPFRLSVPGWSGFEKAGIWLHETVGWHIYRRRGWISP